MTTVAVIGAGLTGASTALALAGVGYDVELFEQAAQILEAGAGVSLSPNALRSLDYVGVSESVRQVGDAPGPAPILHYRTARLLLEVPRDGDLLREGRAGFIQLLRADLIEVLVRFIRQTPRIRLHLGHRLADLGQVDGKVRMRFVNGAEFDSDLLVGCDGLRSRVRALLFDAGEARPTGQTAWRCLVPTERVAAFMSAGPSAIYIGPRRVVNRYCVRHGQLVNVVAIARTDRVPTEGWLQRSTYAEFLAEFRGWHEDVLEIVRHAPEGQLFAWTLYDRDSIQSWTQGRVTLAGDAAHPMLPFLGLGAALGMEDAVVLARCLDAYGPEEAALQRFAAARIDRCANALKDARRQGELYQAADPDRYGTVGTSAELRLPYFDYDAVTAAI